MNHEIDWLFILFPCREWNIVEVTFLFVCKKNKIDSKILEWVVMDSNHWPFRCKRIALPTELNTLWKTNLLKSDEGGFEPPILIQYAGFQDRYLKPLRHSSQKIKNCLEADSNCRHKDFQSFALPTELSRLFDFCVKHFFWDERIRTFECRIQIPMPYHLATSHVISWLPKLDLNQRLDG